MRNMIFRGIVLLILSSCAFAGVTHVDFDDAFGGYEVVVSSLVVDVFSGPHLSNVQVRSEAYHKSGSSDYVYLYQVENHSMQDLSEFWIFDFAGVKVADMGYLSASPAGFKTPSSPDSVYAEDDYAVFSFVRMSPSLGLMGTLHTGETSAVLFIRSKIGPKVLDAGVSGDGFAMGEVVGAHVPEPMTLSLLAIGGVMVARKRRK